MDPGLSGKNAIITGASRGIGHATAPESAAAVVYPKAGRVSGSMRSVDGGRHKGVF